MSNNDFIVFGLQPWDFEMGSNSKNIAIELAKHNRVLYVNRPIERSSLYRYKNDIKIKNRLNSLKEGIGVLHKEMNQLWVFNPRVILESINWLPTGKVYDALNKLNARRLAHQIKWAMNQLCFENSILLIDNDFLKAYYLNDYLKADTLVYYIRDYLLSQPYFIRHGYKMEPKFISKVDVVVANSSYLTDYATKYNPNSFDIGQGCDLKSYAFDTYDIPDDLKYIQKPIIGYCGALLQTRLDLNLLQELAQRKEEWSFVFVGPEDAAFQMSPLHKLSNVHFLGQKTSELLPAYIHHFDVCINPQLINQMTVGNYPRKIDEYLAAGGKVVATKTQAMQMFEDYCFLANDEDSFVNGIDKMLSEKESEADIIKRRRFAQYHTWEASVNSLYKAINIVNHQKIKAC